MGVTQCRSIIRGVFLKTVGHLWRAPPDSLLPLKSWTLHSGLGSRLLSTCWASLPLVCVRHPLGINEGTMEEATGPVNRGLERKARGGVSKQHSL